MSTTPHARASDAPARAARLFAAHAAEGARGDEGDVIALVDRLLAGAVAARASDVHLEAGVEGVRVRHRVDGVLREVERLAPAVGPPLVSRLKILAALDIADRLRPQDGRAHVTVGGRRVDLRVSTLPAARGENVVLRLQDPAAGLESLDALGLVPAARARLDALLAGREGLVLVTGPTGSGKTTTLYAALRALLLRGGLNVVTVEDPVERRIPGIVQVQVHERAGLTFAAALRSILRQDPDVVLVGEIRDRETATVAAQAALTGHLVLATLHTLDAASAVTRLADLGVEPGRLAAALRGAVAQRLVRRLCDGCRRGAEPETRAGGTAPCPACEGAGYRGRVAVMEVLPTAPVAALVARGTDADAIAAAARAAGLPGLWEAGLEQVRAGATDLAELRRVLDLPAPPAPATVRERPVRATAGSPAPPSPRAVARRLPDLDGAFELL